jgi:hypothetical protein
MQVLKIYDVARLQACVSESQKYTAALTSQQEAKFHLSLGFHVGA